MSAGVDSVKPSTTSDALRRWMLPVALPVLLVALILEADVLEGPKTAYVGVIAVVPMLAAVFGTPGQTAFVGLISWIAALGFGLIASDGNVTAQRVRLVIIAASAVGAVFAARSRVRRENDLQLAVRERAQLEQMRHDATTDVLTKTLNRRGILTALDSVDRELPWTIAIADCDNFKAINDKFGHIAGDRYLETAGLRLMRAVSEKDVVGRWGGDEFLLALPLALEQAEPVLARVLEQVTREPVVSDDKSLRVSLTFGAAQWATTESLDEVIVRADGAMFRGKELGIRVLLAAD